MGNPDAYDKSLVIPPRTDSIADKTERNEASGNRFHRILKTKNLLIIKFNNVI